jgi:hypothetical protein
MACGRYLVLGVVLTSCGYQAFGPADGDVADAAADAGLLVADAGGHSADASSPPDGGTVDGGSGPSNPGQCALSSGGYTVSSNPLPGSCYVYPLDNSMWANRVPVDAMQHLWNAASDGLPQQGDYYARMAMTARGAAPVNCSTFAAAQGGKQPSGCNDNMGGETQFASASSDAAHPRSNRDGNQPLYYAKASDPVFSIGGPGNGTTCNNGPYESDNVCTVFHAPAGAQYVWYGGGFCFASSTAGAAGQPDHFRCEYDSQCSSSYPHCLGSSSASSFQISYDDSFIDVLDQSQQIFVASEGGHAGADGLQLPLCSQGNCGPACGGHAGTLDDPCPLPMFSYQAAESYANDWDWRTGAHSESSNGVPEYLGVSMDNGAGMAAGGAALVRLEEFQTGIFHLVQGASWDNSKLPTIWPGTVAANANNADANGLPGGAWVFLDYTDAQIEAMALSPIQKVLITQLAHYGSILENWANSSFSQFSESFESDMPYFAATGQHHPFFSWVKGQTIGVASTGYQYTMDCYGGDNTTPGDSQYDCEIASLYGLPILPGPGSVDASGRSCATGCDVSGHLHVLDPGALAGYIGPGKRSGEPAPTVGLVVAMLAGSGAGTISSVPAGVNCDHVTQCNMAMGIGKTVTLTATPASGHVFKGWSGGGCSSSASCNLIFAQSPQIVTATFQ